MSREALGWADPLSKPPLPQYVFMA